MTPDEFRRYGHQLIDWIADYRETLSARPVMSQSSPGEIRRQLPKEAPEHGVPLAAVLADLERVVLPGITHWNHPSFFAYFPSNAGLSSVLADLASPSVSRSSRCVRVWREGGREQGKADVGISEGSPPLHGAVA